MQTKNLADEKFEKLKELFPNAITESIDENGNLVRTIDKDVLAQEISNEVVEGRDERYQFTWPEKRKAILNANAPISKTLRPCREESLNFDETENLYIEGDNLEVLKLLQETYLGKVKMIYIDPPYNTGSDFVYNDDFKQSTDEYLEDSGQFDKDGNRLEKNLESNGRFHTDWLNMIYPRLKLARNLLSDDGVIFISIDDNEQANLKKGCDEIFGEDNFIANICRQAIKGGSRADNIKTVHDYVLIYAKSKNDMNPFTGLEKEDIEYPYEDGKGPYAIGRELNKWGAGSRREDSPTMWFPISGPNGEEVYPIRNDGSEGRWRWGKSKLLKAVEQGEVVFNQRDNGTYIVYEKIRELKNNTTYFNTWFENNYINAKGSETIKKFFNTMMSLFDYSKPVELIYILCFMVNNKNAIILDFFSGSATTAHAVMELNAEDGGNRKFIMVQLPEETDEKSEAYKAGYKNICEIGKERIRRAGKKIIEDNKDKDGIENLDIGFRVLKTDSSNMKDVYYRPGQLNQNFLDTLTDNIKDDRTGEDLLFQVMLDLGVPLSSEIQVENIDGKEVYLVDQGYIIACFDKDIDDDLVTKIAKRGPAFAIFRDSSMVNDSALNNFDQIFERLSPETTRRVI